MDGEGPGLEAQDNGIVVFPGALLKRGNGSVVPGDLEEAGEGGVGEGCEHGMGRGYGKGLGWGPGFEA